jgi:hypothetical protein
VSTFQAEGRQFESGRAHSSQFLVVLGTAGAKPVLATAHIVSQGAELQVASGRRRARSLIGCAGEIDGGQRRRNRAAGKAGAAEGDRNLLERISADQWQDCGRSLGTYTDELLRSADRGSLGESEIARASDALALWIPDLRVMLINESHPAFDGLDEPSLAYDLSRVAWHEWGHALSIDRTAEDDIAAGERYVELLPDGVAMFVRKAGYRRREYTHEVVAEIYAILMIRRRQGTTGRPPWLDPEVYELVRRVAGWNQ